MDKNKMMNSLVKTAKGKGLVELREVTVPEIGDNEVLIEVKAAGICGTDLHIYHDEFPYWPPVILGHEFSGVIASAGKNVKDWKKGDRVVGEPHTLACGKCWLCRTGNRQICPEKRSPGWGIDGCFAKYMRYPEPNLLHRIPDTLSFEKAALVEPTANVVTDIIERGALRPRDFTVVIGPGPIGLIAAMVAKAGGASKVVVIGTDVDEELRLPAARKISSIDHVINVSKENTEKIIMDMTEGKGADLIIEASGSAPGISLAVKLVRKLGRITAIGLTGKDKIEFPYDAGMSKSIEFIFNMSTLYSSWDKSICLLNSGKINADVLITHKGGIENWEQFFFDLENKRGIKGMFTF
ncbi:MAG: alcohol dehydrogenase catalytic domain-containing protein [Ignavibacteria bacterium]|jgi:2-desacetyl-2-hydroxyethyl bacteriochlorophyllide A dehydrogenase